MTKGLETLYCVCCLSLRSIEETVLVFRTGYYEVKTSLGVAKLR